MYLYYLDESGPPQWGAETSRFVMIGLAIPAAAWHEMYRRVNAIKTRYSLKDIEIHAGYLARRFPEQEHIQNFDKLDSVQRRTAVQTERNNSLIKAAALKSGDRLKLSRSSTLNRLITST